MSKTDFYDKFDLHPDSGTVVNSWGAIQKRTGKVLLQCWNDEKTYIKKADRTDDAVMIVKVVSPVDRTAARGGGPARVKSVQAIMDGAMGFVAVSTGTYPDWIGLANLDQVYPILSLFEKDGSTFAKLGSPTPTVEAFRL
jgi:hypothetical protein